MKTDRFVILLAGLLILIAAGLPTAGQTFNFQIGRSTPREDPAKALAAALALQVAEVQKRFDTNRRTLRPVQGPGGEPVYSSQETAGVIARTGEDLDQAMKHVKESGLEPLRAWAAEELGRIQGELTPAPGPFASLPGRFAPRAVARIASLREFGLPLLASTKPSTPKPETVPAGTANRLLDQVGEVVNRIFVLAAHDDLEVNLWVGSTPAPKATFRFWPEGRIKGSTPAPTIIRTVGKKGHVLRGLYSYRAALGDGAVTELIAYPNAAGVSADRSERLDLVTGTRFFCCRFKEQYCHHVADEQECRP